MELVWAQAVTVTPQNAVSALDIASLNGHQDICDELEYHTSQETKTEITEVSGSVGCMC